MDVKGNILLTLRKHLKRDFFFLWKKLTC